jgi:hypothetical protein
MLLFIVAGLIEKRKRRINAANYCEEIHHHPVIVLLRQEKMSVD